MSKADPTKIFRLLNTPYKSLLEALRRTNEVVFPEDIHDNHLLILFAIDREFGSNQKQLADMLFISKQSIGVSIDFLISRKYLHKARDPVDARANLVKLTEKGWALIDTSKIELKKYLKLKIGIKNFKKLFGLLTELSLEFDRINKEQ